MAHASLRRIEEPRLSALVRGPPCSNAQFVVCFPSEGALVPLVAAKSEWI